MRIGFEEFWEIYPRRVGKIDAQKAYDKAITRTTVDKIRVAAKRYADLCKDKSPEYVAHPATWLNRGSWDDEMPAPPKPQSYGPRSFPAEQRASPGFVPRENWAQLLVPKEHHRYAEMVERSESFDADPRHYQHEDRGIRVLPSWWWGSSRTV